MVQLLRGRVERAVQANGRRWAAERLRLSEPGVDAVLWDPSWTAGTAVHLAGCLDVLTDDDLDRLENTA
jgi:hypothetical protein